MAETEPTNTTQQNPGVPGSIPLITEQRIKKYTQLREKYFASITATYDLLNKLTSGTSHQAEFLARAERIDEIFNSFETVQLELININSSIPEGQQVPTTASSEACETLYYRIKAAAAEVSKKFKPPPIASSSQATAPPSTSETSKARMPKIVIEPFSGQIEKFQSFRSLFDTLVHNTNMSKIEKYSYLRSLLLGKALSVIQTIEFSEANYEFAYSKLCDEFSNKRLLGHHYLSKILSAKCSQLESADSLRQFIDSFHVNARALQDLDFPHLSDFIMLHLALKTIPSDTRRLFENEHIKDATLPTLEKLVKYVKNRIAILEISGDSKRPSACPAVKKAFMTSHVEPPKAAAKHKDPPVTRCPHCADPHRLMLCPKFLAALVPERFEIVKGAKLCFACLGKHNRQDCKSTFSCRLCSKKSHHTLLHNPTEKEVMVSVPPLPALTCNSSENQNRVVLLGTAIAKIQDFNGLWHPVRLILDPGSMLSFITSSLAHTLCLPRHPSSNQICGIGNSKVQQAKGVVNVRVSPQENVNGTILQFSAEVLPAISSAIPSTPISQQIAQRFSGIKLADPSIFERPSKVDLLIGASHFAQIMQSDKVIIPGEPSCVPTIFGYVLMGEVDESGSRPLQHRASLFTSVQETPIDEMLKRFWQLEDISEVEHVSPEDKACEEHFERTYYRDEAGRFVVSLPFKDGQPPELGSTRHIALQRFKSLENRFKKDERVKQMYQENIKDYILQDQLSVATLSSEYILPHHAVIKEDSISHPVRVVFNASQVSDTSRSLNSALYIGPKLQNNVDDVILLFRLYAVPLCADIKQMYRAIMIHPPDRKYQHIFWRFNETDELHEWELNRLSFGLSPASYIAQKCLRKLAELEKLKYPRACKVIEENSYVDDIVTGADSVSDAQALKEELCQLLRSGGFVLRKFCSSYSEVVSHPKDDTLSENLSLNKEVVKVLGLEWESTTDSFCYTLASHLEKPTKRILLSHAASIYDINGHMAHLVIFIKILIQRLWLARLDWDSPVPDDIHGDWCKFVSELPSLKNLRIPRHIINGPTYTHQLVGFSDASGSAMSALFYLRVVSPSGEVHTQLLRAKSRVSPLKVLSIPRLELTAAFLLIKLLRTLDFLITRLNISDVCCFTDSTTVLAWIQTPPHQLKTFAANRVAEIISRTQPSQWRYVPTSSNPADLATRGLLPHQVIETYDFWFRGPPFLIKEESQWPKHPENSLKQKDIPELKSSANIALLVQENSDPHVVEMIRFFEKFSSLLKLQRVLSWILRFKNNCLKGKADRVLDPCLLSKEYEESLFACLKVTQQFYFHHEFKALAKDQPYLGSLKNLSPFISDRGFITVGGRLANSPLPPASKHPLLVPSKSHLAKLLVDHYHLFTLHGNAKIIQSLLQRQFWIIGARDLIKRRVFSCVKCYKLSATPKTPYMGDIPISRFTQGRCFCRTSVDYAGPYLLKDGSRRNSPTTKCYMVVFVCMSVKAVHLELANSLSLESCLAALDRFCSRRSRPLHIYSDQGTNFKASARHITEVQRFLKENNTPIQQHLSAQGITWHFHPPGAPNFSGLAEAGVKSAKHHLIRALDNRPLTQEEFCTLLCQVEAVLNSRPLCAVSNVPDEGVDYLTPGHFLVGGPLLARPELDISEEPKNLIGRWKMLTRITQVFWRRWRNEYLHTQMQRCKWQAKYPDLKLNDVVLIISDNEPPLNWPLARVVKLFRGSDNVVRVAEVQGPKGLLTRPVSKLLPLPFCVQ